MSADPSYWLDHFNGDGALAALVVGGLTRRKCEWCEVELRPCNMRRHVEARHFRQLTIYDALADQNLEPAEPAKGQKKTRAGRSR